MIKIVAKEYVHSMLQMNVKLNEFTGVLKI